MYIVQSQFQRQLQLRESGREEGQVQVFPINLCARLFLKTPSFPPKVAVLVALDTGASLARALSFLPPSFLLHFGRIQPASLAAAARV